MRRDRENAERGKLIDRKGCRPTDPMRIVAPVLFAVLVFIDSHVRANIIGDLAGLGGDSGKLAKLEFRLKESFYVTAVAWSPNCRFIAISSTQRRLVHIWDVKTREVIKEVILGSAVPYYHDVSWSPDSRFVAFCDGPGSILRIYDSRDWSLAHTIGPEHAQGCEHVAFSSDGKQLAVLATNLFIASVGDWKPIKESRLHKGWGLAHEFHAVEYLPYTHTILLGGWQFHNVSTTAKYEGRAAGHVWFLLEDETEPHRDIQAYSTEDRGGGGVSTLAVAPDGTQIAAGTDTGSGTVATGMVTQSVRMFDVTSGKLLGAPLDGNLNFGVQTGLAYSADGRFLLVGHEEERTETIHIIDANSHTVVDVVHGSGSIYDIAADPSGPRFAAATGREVIVWSVSGQREGRNHSVRQVPITMGVPHGV